MARPVTRPVLLCFALVLVVAGCESVPEKQWYKPGGAYTLADFRNDEKACTRERRLDEACMTSRGWVPLSGDIESTKSDPAPAKGRTPGRY